ncbi:hypothetical protein IJ818_02855 [bacterium]|nr:hypothetical protein [bacterium]
MFRYTIILWSLITVFRILNHIPWFDEAHAWTIAQELNLVQIFDLMKVEGHTFIWYLLLMPFAKLHLWYPYSMQFLNWIFCFSALIILWKKAPFNNFIKVLIIFSYPFLFLYSVYARCYSIGIMLLFLLTAMFENKLKHPVLYSIILVLCANTSLMAMIGATAFGILFLYDFIKSKPYKKELFISLLVLLIGVILVLIQIVGVDDSAISDYKGIDFELNSIIAFCFLGILLGISCILPMLLNIKNCIKSLFFILFTSGFMTYCFLFRYYGHYWNHCFYLIYLIISIWLNFDCYKNFKFNSVLKIFSISVFSFIIFLNWFIPYLIKSSPILKIITYGKDLKLAKIILNDSALKNKYLVFSNNFFAAYILYPYNKYKLVDYCTGENFGYKIVNQNKVSKILYVKNCYLDFYIKDEKDLEQLFYITSSNEVYSNVPIDKNILNTLNSKYSINVYNCVDMVNKNYCFYKFIKYQ